MSSATTIHDGCGDIVNLLLSCIILIVYENQTLLPLHMYLYFTFVTLFLLRKGEFVAKYENWLEYVSDFIIFCLW